MDQTQTHYQSLYQARLVGKGTNLGISPPKYHIDRVMASPASAPFERFNALLSRNYQPAEPAALKRVASLGLVSSSGLPESGGFKYKGRSFNEMLEQSKRSRMLIDKAFGLHLQSNKSQYKGLPQRKDPFGMQSYKAEFKSIRQYCSTRGFGLPGGIKPLALGYSFGAQKTGQLQNLNTTMLAQLSATSQIQNKGKLQHKGLDLFGGIGSLQRLKELNADLQARYGQRLQQLKQEHLKQETTVKPQSPAKQAQGVSPYISQLSKQVADIRARAMQSLMGKKTFQPNATLTQPGALYSPLSDRLADHSLMQTERHAQNKESEHVEFTKISNSGPLTALKGISPQLQSRLQALNALLQQDNKAAALSTEPQQQQGLIQTQAPLK